VRVWGLAGIVATSSVVAHAEPRLEASGFLGLASFSEDTELGNSWAPDQVPSTSLVLGARLGWIGWSLAPRVQLGIEAELSLAPAFTGEARGERMSYFAPVFGWTAHALVRFDRFHLVAGGGGETVASSSPFMAKETDPVVYWGPGVSVRVSDRVALRFDLRHGVMPDRGDGVTSTIALQGGVTATFGVPQRRRIVTPIVERDSPALPAQDPDRDGVLADRCADQPEDRDGFADDDGCPDPDNDGDGVADADDKCPLDVETKNHVADADGCPDVIPQELVEALANLKSIRFEPKRARLTPAARAALQKVLVHLLEHRGLKIAIAWHPAGRGGESLAKRRAEAVKWFFLDGGVTADRLLVAPGAIAKHPIQAMLVSGP
jgi:OOP family OmpA-OmpF porin